MANPHPTETVAHTEAPGGHGAAEATAFGIGPGFYVALAMLVVFALTIWKKVPAAIGKSLDKKIALIREQLAEAEALRKEAEALKAEYEAKAKSADKEAKAMLEARRGRCRSDRRQGRRTMPRRWSPGARRWRNRRSPPKSAPRSTKFAPPRREARRPPPPS